MKPVYTCLCTAFLLFACQSSEKKSAVNEISEIRLLHEDDTLGFAKGYADSFLNAFKAAKETSAHKQIGAYQIQIHYADQSMKSFKSNGMMHTGNNLFLQSDFNIIDRYRQYGELDTIPGQLHTVAGLQVVLKTAEIEKAPEFFSTRIQEKLFKIAEKGGNLGEWAAAWNLDSAGFAKYKLRILEGRGRFIFENGAWRINEL